MGSGGQCSSLCVNACHVRWREDKKLLPRSPTTKFTRRLMYRCRCDSNNYFSKYAHFVMMLHMKSE